MATVALKSGFKPARVPLLCNSIARMATAANAATGETNDSVSWDNARPYEDIPGPKPLPIIGNLLQFIPGIGDLGNRNLIEQQSYLFKKYGKIVKISRVPGRRDVVILYDPKYFEEMHRNEGPWPDRNTAEQCLTYYRKVYRKDFFEGVGGVLTECGEEWKKFRTKVNPPMMQPRVAHNYLRPIVDVSNDFIERSKSLRDLKGEMPEDYVNELNKWSLESIAMIALDHRLGCMEPSVNPDSEAQRMINAVDDFFSCLGILEMRTPFWKIMSTPTWRRFVRALDYFTDVSMKHINDAIKRMQERKPGEKHEPSVLEKLLLRDPNPKTACVMALDMLIAGVDTTSFSVASLLYHLSKNPDKQQHLFKELVRFLPNKNDDITIKMTEDMKYLKACMKESMRISGIAIGTLRGTPKDIVIGNYRIPKNVNVFMPHLFIGNMEKYCPLAAQFIPERWLKTPPGGGDSVGSAEDFDKVNGLKTNPFAFMPFGFGPRMCIGRRFAELEFTIIIIKMIRNFQVEYNYEDMEFASMLLHKPISPLKFKLTDRPI